MYPRIIVISLLFLVSLLFVWKSWPDNDVHVVACDVGQGDASLIYSGFSQVLIDTGKSYPAVEECLGSHMAFWDRRLDMVVISHPQLDHYGALLDLLNHFTVGYLIMSNTYADGEYFTKIQKYIHEQNVRFIQADSETSLSLGKLRFKVLWPLAQSDSQLEKVTVSGREFVVVKDPNERSLVLSLEAEGVSALFTGDIGIAEEEKILASFPSINVHILKVAHHGSKNSTSELFLEKFRPKIALIEVGKNSFGHPAPEIIERLEKVQTKVFRTDVDGEVELMLQNGFVLLK